MRLWAAFCLRHMRDWGSTKPEHMKSAGDGCRRFCIAEKYLFYLKSMPTILAKHVVFSLFAKKARQKPDAASKYSTAHSLADGKALLVVAHDLNVGALALWTLDRSHTVGRPPYLVIVQEHYTNGAGGLQTGFSRREANLRSISPVLCMGGGVYWSGAFKI